MSLIGFRSIENRIILYARIDSGSVFVHFSMPSNQKTAFLLSQVHVCILVCEAKLEASLLYALRAVTWAVHKQERDRLRSMNQL